MEQEHIEWCRRMYDMIAVGGIWGVPRSGLLFRKEERTLVLDAIMEYDIQMSITARQLAEQQQSDYSSIKRHFEAAGISVRSDVLAIK